MTHDLLEETLRVTGHWVSRVAITGVVGTTYLCTVYYSAPSGGEIAVDARPSDGLNLAIRFGAPILVHSDVVQRFAQPPSHEDPGAAADDIREEILEHEDPTLMLHLQMQLAVLNEDFEQAVALSRELDRVVRGDRRLALLVALEAALGDGRMEDARAMRDELRRMRAVESGSSGEEEARPEPPGERKAEGVLLV